MKFVIFLKSWLIFCFWMFVNKLFTYLTCAYLKKGKGVLMWNLQDIIFITVWKVSKGEGFSGPYFLFFGISVPLTFNDPLSCTFALHNFQIQQLASKSYIARTFLYKQWCFSVLFSHCVVHDFLDFTSNHCLCIA